MKYIWGMIPGKKEFFTLHQFSVIAADITIIVVTHTNVFITNVWIKLIWVQILGIMGVCQMEDNTYLL
jgi:hypothetical protein